MGREDKSKKELKILSFCFVLFLAKINIEFAEEIQAVSKTDVEK